MASVIWSVIFFLTYAIGTGGNILSIIICRRKSIRKTKLTFYLTSLAVCDTVALNSGLARWAILYGFDIDLKETSVVLCQSLAFLVSAAADMSCWVLTMVTIQRFVGVCIPLKINVVCGYRGMRASLGMAAILAFGKNLHFLVTSWSTGHTYLVYDNQSAYFGCTPVKEGYTRFVLLAWPMVEFVFQAGLPFVVILTCNIMIIAKLISRQKNKDAKHNNPATQDSGHKKLTSMTIMLLVTNISFLILTSSIYGMWIYWKFADIDETAFETMRPYSLLLYYLNFAINFFLYVISGPMFRRELVCLLKRKSKIHAVNSIQIEQTCKNPPRNECSARQSIADTKTDA